MTSEIDKLKHFHVENYSGTNFTDDLNDGEEFLYTTIRIKDNILTGRYFSICLLQQHDINKGWMPKPTQIIDCVEVEILLKILVLLLNNLVILPVEDRIKFILHGESTLLILLIMELEEKVKELIKWYMDTYGVNKD